MTLLIEFRIVMMLEHVGEVLEWRVSNPIP
jgi:hypothetical protein